MTPKSEQITEIRLRRGSIVFKAQASLKNKDWAAQGKPNTEPYLRIALFLRPVEGDLVVPYRKILACVYADRPLALVMLESEKVAVGVDTFPIYNLQDLRPFLRRAWRKLAHKWRPT